MAAVFVTTDNVARWQNPRRRVRTAAQLTDGLYIVEVFQCLIEVGEVKRLGKRQWRNGLADIVELLNTTHAAAGASVSASTLF